MQSNIVQPSKINIIQNLKSLGDLLPKPFAGNEVSPSTYSQALLDQIRSNEPWLTAIRLNSKSLSDIQVKSLCEALICNRVVEEVHLSNNRIGDDGATSIGHMLKFNRYLKEINLDGNLIGPKGAAALASALAANTTLTALNLGNNHIGVEGAGAFAASLCHNRSITTLSISNNSIPEHHSIHNMIHKMIRSNKQYPENQSLVVGLGGELASLISTMSTDMAEELVLQAEEALKVAMICRRKGDAVGAAEAEGIFIRICTKGQAPLDPPEEGTNDDDASEDPPEANNLDLQPENPVYRMYSRKQSEPDRLGEINDELRTLTYNDDSTVQGDESFEQIASMAGEEKHDVSADQYGADAIGSMPEQFLDAVKVEEVLEGSFQTEVSDEEAGDVSAEWIGNVYASE